MEHQDNLFEQFKKAAEKSETKDFPGMEKVWSRVDAKLDTQVYQTQKKTNISWKKFAVAASVAITVLFAYQFLKPIEKGIPTQENAVTLQDTTRYVAPNTEETVVTSDKAPEIINKKEAEKILNHQISAQQQVAVSSPTIQTHDTMRWMAKPSLAPKAEENATRYSYNAAAPASSGVYEADSKDKSDLRKEAKSVQTRKKADPLVVVNGEALTEDKKADYVAEEMESIVELKNPLYIINGVEYTEQEVFGPNATSPYYPLNKQEIEKITIYQNEEAFEKFGRKGDNGVVVIQTKNGKPAVLKK